ncbi:MAG: SPOR domain-containing protein [Pseudomonadota bacterium]
MTNKTSWTQTRRRLTGAVIFFLSVTVVLLAVREITQWFAKPAQNSVEMPEWSYLSTSQTHEVVSNSDRVRADTFSELQTELNQRQQSNGTTSTVAQASVWALQVGSFNNDKNASELVARLKELEFEVFIREVKRQNKNYYQVLVGPELVFANVEEQYAKLTKLNFQAIVVPYD